MYNVTFSCIWLKVNLQYWYLSYNLNERKLFLTFAGKLMMEEWSMTPRFETLPTLDLLRAYLSARSLMGRKIVVEIKKVCTPKKLFRTLHW